ncbi:hypothetical protein DFH08DRAFT_820414 [Mycena albidolilacea]|uniref:Uncharacterized protein n=1 Tax=Mycena albidolilacea TaxID=1033008 RepID=A0AAD6ZC85_9AGAR|nr:hypothetical protein DFH08DRAFT_820414 [Mycena albidolilacea]
MSTPTSKPADFFLRIPKCEGDGTNWSVYKSRFSYAADAAEPTYNRNPHREQEAFSAVGSCGRGLGGACRIAGGGGDVCAGVRGGEGAVADGAAVAERETEGGVGIVDDEGGREGGKETRDIRTTLTRRTLLLLQSEGGDVLGLALGLETRACFDQVGAASRQHRTKRDGGRDAGGPTLGGVGGGCEAAKDAGSEAGGAIALLAAEPDG